VELLVWADVKPPQVKVRYLEGDLAGLEEFVSPRHVVCKWKSWPRILHDEERQLALESAVEKRGIRVVEGHAAELVFTASGEDIFVEERRGYTRGLDQAALERLAQRAGLQERPWLSRPSFGRSGVLMVDNEALIRLAEAFSRAEPSTVTMYLDSVENEYRARGFQPGDTFWHDYLRENGPAIAVARLWAGGQQARDHHMAEAERLRNLVADAIRTLRAAGHEVEATRLQRALTGAR
jgi:hypothetical protein